MRAIKHSVIEELSKAIEEVNSSVNHKDLSDLLIFCRNFFRENPRNKAAEFYKEVINHVDLPSVKIEKMIKSMSDYLRKENGSKIVRKNPVLVGTVIAASGFVLQGGAELLMQKDVVRIRKLAIQRYVPPEKSKIALIIPCTKTKPYKHSRTHKRICGALEELSASTDFSAECLDILVVSEPLGIVPKKWEMHYPVMNYDMVLPSWLPLSKFNESKDYDERQRTFSKVSEISKKITRKEQGKRIIEDLSKHIAEFLEAHIDKYEVILPFIRSTHKTMLQKAMEKVGIEIPIFPTQNQTRDIIKKHGKLHWAFQGLRGSPALGILKRKTLDYWKSFC